MKQLLQSVSHRTALVTDVPAPGPGRGEVLVRVSASLISAGTERTAIDFADKNLIQKALSRPDLVRQVADKAKREGILSTWNTVRNRLDTDLALGYSCAGTVLAVGAGISNFRPGDRVACAGGGYASHAEFVRVPTNLACRIPEGDPSISFEEAAFTTVSSIAMQGFRLAEPQLGETLAVIGLGLIGLLLVQIAKAAGCTVIGLDPAPNRCHLAEQLGCDATAHAPELMRQIVAGRTGSHGADAVIITAATSSNGPVELAGELARHRGRVIVVGAVGLQLPRQPFYEKELVFRISCSYGPGRYDSEYEEKGRDYPIGFARWTENRNMQAVLQLISAGKLKVLPLITHRFSIEEAEKGYQLIAGKIDEPFLGIVITYPEQSQLARRIDYVAVNANSVPSGKVGVGFVGAGNFATGVLLPAMKKTAGIDFAGICTRSGATAHGVGSRLGFRYSTTDFEELLRDESINTIAITTRHSSHSAQICAALASGKHVFCEKPLCVSEEQLADIVRQYYASSRPMLMVGFNRRFAPLSLELKRFIQEVREPLLITYRVNAGYIPLSHWVQDPEQGAGRIIGEVCHFVDFCSYLTGSAVTNVQASVLPNGGRYRDDNLTATLMYENGSIAVTTYVANGDKTFPKERIEVFGGGCVAVLDDFRSVALTSTGHKKVFRSRFTQDKGHANEWQAFAAAVKNGSPSPISFEQIVNTTLTTFKIAQACASGNTQSLNADFFVSAAIEAHIPA